jgi:hypothetical protein
MLFFFICVFISNTSFARISYNRNSQGNFGNLQPSSPSFFNVSMSGTSSPNVSVISGDVTMLGSPVLGHVTLTTNKTGIAYSLPANVQLIRNSSVIDFAPTATAVGDPDTTIDLYIGGVITNSGVDLETGRYRGTMALQIWDDTWGPRSKNIRFDVRVDPIPVSVTMTKSDVNMGAIIINDGKRVTFSMLQDGSTSIVRGDFSIEGSPSLATFDVSGQPNQTINFNSSAVSIGDGNGNFITATPIVDDASLDASGTLSSTVGMKLNIPAGTPMGSYSGNYTVDANY